MLAIASAQEGVAGDVVTIYEISSGSERAVLDMPGQDTVGHMTFSPDGRVLMATLEGSSARWWDTATGAQTFGTPGGVGEGADITRMAMSPSGTLVAFGRQKGRVELWSMTADTDRWEPLEVSGRHRDRVTWIDFDAEGSRVVSTSADGQVMIWDAATGELADGPRGFDAASAMTFFLPGSTTRLMTINSYGGTLEWDLERAGILQSVAGVEFGASGTRHPAPAYSWRASPM
jgi:WD40 repeat protein